MRVVTWNLERKNPVRGLGRSAVERLMEWQPDVAVVTESRVTMPPADGRWWWSTEPTEGRFDVDERKVGVWAREPAELVDPGPDGPDASRIVVIRLADSGVFVVAVCIPWHFAGVRAGTDRLWGQHLEFLGRLGPLLGRLDGPVVVAGDVNQRAPRSARGARKPAAALMEALDGFRVVTSGVLDGVERVGIDHIAVSSGIEARAVWGWPASDGERRHSDHDGAGAELVIG